jgi:MFS transporter, putative metabolite:H+ symporter
MNEPDGARGLMPGSAQELGAVTDRLAPTNRHRKLVAAVSGLLFIDGFDLAMAGGITGALIAAKWMTIGQGALFMAATGLGGAIGNFLGGVLADKYGRQPTMRLVMVVIGVFTLLCAIATSPGWLIVFRLLSALGMGALPTICYLLMIESLPSRVRVRWTAFCGAGANLAILAAGLLSFVLLPAGAWRWMFILPGIGALCAAILCRYIPESPRWLQSVGRLKDARAVVTYLTGSHLEHNRPEAANAGASPVTEAPALPIGSVPVRPNITRNLTLAVIIALCANLSSNGTLAWLPTMLLHKGFSIKDSLGYNLIITAGVPVGTLLAALFADKLPRRVTIGLASAVCVLFTLVFSLVGTGFVALAAGFGSLLTILFTYGISVGVYIHELFPTSIRGRAVSTASSISRVGLILMPFPMSWMINNIGALAPMLFIAGLMGLLGMAVVLIGRETRGAPLDR